MALESVMVTFPFPIEETPIEVKGFERKYLDISDLIKDVKPQKHCKNLLENLWFCQYISTRYK